jgi:outer membrane protein assembly factor BamB
LLLRRRDWLLVFLVSLLLFQLYGVAKSGADAGSSGDDWPMFLHDPAHTGQTASAGPSEPLELWRFPVGDAVVTSAAVVNGVVYVAGNDNIYALDAYTGAELWSYPMPYHEMYSSPAVSEGVLFAGVAGELLALDASSGTEVWSYPTENPKDRVISSPAVVDDVVYVGYPEGCLFALNASTGSKIWDYTTKDMGNGVAIQSSPAVVDGVVYFGSPDDNVYALKASTGEKIWNHTVRNDVSSAPAVSEGVVYVSSHFGYLYALSAASGKELWHFTVSDQVQNLKDYSPTIAGGVVYVRSSDGGQLYALDASNGDLKWENPGSFYIRGSSAAIVGGVVYSGTSALNASTGEELWQFPTNATIYASPAVSNGVLYVASRDGYFYAIGEPLTTPPPTPTPNPKADSFFLTWIIIAVGVLAVFGLVLLFYFRKRRHN